MGCPEGLRGSRGTSVVSIGVKGNVQVSLGTKRGVKGVQGVNGRPCVPGDHEGCKGCPKGQGNTLGSKGVKGVARGVPGGQGTTRDVQGGQEGTR